jgi:hypothetical protein
VRSRCASTHAPSALQNHGRSPSLLRRTRGAVPLAGALRDESDDCGEGAGQQVRPYASNLYGGEWPRGARPGRFEYSSIIIRDRDDLRWGGWPVPPPDQTASGDPIPSDHARPAPRVRPGPAAGFCIHRRCVASLPSAASQSASAPSPLVVRGRRGPSRRQVAERASGRTGPGGLTTSPAAPTTYATADGTNRRAGSPAATAGAPLPSSPQAPAARALAHRAGSLQAGAKAAHVGFCHRSRRGRIELSVMMGWQMRWGVTAHTMRAFRCRRLGAGPLDPSRKAQQFGFSRAASWAMLQPTGPRSWVTRHTAAHHRATLCNLIFRLAEVATAAGAVPSKNGLQSWMFAGG